MADGTEPATGADSPDDAGEQKGIMVPVVLILFGILIAMVVFMNLTSQNTTAAGAITETSWQLRSMTDYNGVTTPVLNGTVVSARFGLDGRLTGSGGCNGYSGRFLVKETSIVISRVSSTMVACWDPATTQQEKQYFSLLEDADAVRIHDRVLTLYDRDGKLLLTFGPAPAS